MNTLFSLSAILIATTALGWAQTPAETPAFQGYEKLIRVTPLLKTQTTSAGQPIVYPNVAKPEVTAVLVEIPPGANTGWHQHPYPCYAFILEGKLQVELGDGTIHDAQAGQALVESVGMSHIGRNNSDQMVKLVMFVTGEADKPFTIKEAAPAK